LPYHLVAKIFLLKLFLFWQEIFIFIDMKMCLKKILFHLILLTFCFLPTITSGGDSKCIEGNCINGRGIYLYSNGEKYDGEFKNGELSGHGTYTYLDGSKYEGEFANGVRHGQGTLKIIDGMTYVGHWANDLPNGQGVKTLADGMQYSGEFKNGLMYGSGRIVMPDGNNLKVKWDNALTSQKEGDQSDTAGDSDKNKKDWYMTATPGTSQKSLGQGPQSSAGHMKILSQDVSAGENIPPQELDQSAVTTEQVAPQASSVDGVPVKDKDLTEPLGTSKLAEKEKIESEAVKPVEKLDRPESKVIFPQNLKTTKAVEYASIAIGANIRSAASLTAEVLRSVPAGYPVVVLERKEDWLLVGDFRGRKGWVYASLVTEPGTVIIKVFKGNLRSGPSLKNDIIVQLDYGTIMSVLERNGEWLKVSNLEELTGWLNHKVIWPAAAMNEWFNISAVKPN
jgi:SH3-like domain-containing protein